MQQLFSILLINILFCLPVTAQRKIDQSYPLPASKKVNLDFRESSRVKVKSWDKNEVGIQISVSINEGENDNAFELRAQQNNDELYLETLINDAENIPKKNFIMKDGIRYYVKSTDWNSKEIQEFKAMHGGTDISFIGSGIVKDIFIEVFVPKNANLSVYSRNGDIEIENFAGPLVANSRNGAVDISLPQNHKSTFELRTRHGEIYTDLPLEQDKKPEEVYRDDKWNVVSGKMNGGGIPINLESRNGSIYLRKQKM
jgi:hypothetical protein